MSETEAEEERIRFIDRNTRLMAPPHLPEIRLHMADEAHDLWLKTEEELGVMGLPPPFWAFAWAGGQGLGRYILDNREAVAGKRVLDFASGSGLVAIAAALAGAAEVVASDIDPWAATACRLNAAVNDCTVDIVCSDLVGADGEWQVILAGDVFYDRDLATALVAWFDAQCHRGVHVLIGDPGRSYLPKDKLRELATYEVPVLRSLEDSEVKKTTVWAFSPTGSGTAL